MFSNFTINEYICLHLIMILFCWYNFIVLTLNKENYKITKNIFRIKSNLREFTLSIINIIFIEELCYRVYLNEILDYFVEYHNSTHFISSLIFSLSHIVNYILARQYKLNNIRMTIAQIIYTFILSYNYLQNTTPLGSLIIHQYANMFCILIQYILHNDLI
jgi:hypothetical protein